MEKFKQPSKEKVRHWLTQRIASKKAPDMNQIRRALGWDFSDTPKGVKPRR